VLAAVDLNQLAKMFAADAWLMAPLLARRPEQTVGWSSAGMVA
jgi:hypothetical protein